jgi:hypothetical protein
MYQVLSGIAMGMVGLSNTLSKISKPSGLDRYPGRRYQGNQGPSQWRQQNQVQPGGYYNTGYVSSFESDLAKAIALSKDEVHPDDNLPDTTYPVKPVDIKVGEREVRVITQVKDGPCPLIAIANFLVYTGVISFPQNYVEESDVVKVFALILISSS